MKDRATWRAFTNIALIKYWGKRNDTLFLPKTSSLSWTLDAFYTDTQIERQASLIQDEFWLNGEQQSEGVTHNVSRIVNFFRQDTQPVKITSVNHVPTGAGLASSASAYTALVCACNDFFNTQLSSKELSIIARQGSGSASRSLFGGFVRWNKGVGDDSTTSYAEPLAPSDFGMAMVVVVINSQHKKIPSRIGMAHTIQTSPFYSLWEQEVAHDLPLMEDAIRRQNIDDIGQIAEHNAMKMHATMIAANPSFTYWEPDSLIAIQLVRDLREQGIPCYITMDAGPNVKIICHEQHIPTIIDKMSSVFSKEKLIVAHGGTAPYAISHIGGEQLEL